MINEIKQYKFRLHLYLNALGYLVSFCFALLQFFRGDSITGSISLTGSLYFFTVIFLLIKNKYYLWEGRGFILFIPVIILNVINAHPEYGIYWTYVAAISFFLALNLRDACLGVTLFMLVTFYLVSFHYPTPILIRVYTTLFLVSVFSFLLSFSIEKLLIQLNAAVIHDPLTNTLNRHTFNSSIETSLNTLSRYQTPVSLFIFDIDFFRNINDTHGHQAGDGVLVNISSTIQGRLREGDLFFRYGGEEFAILLNHTNQQEAFKLAQELRLLVARQDYGIGRAVTISGGVCEAKPLDQANTWIERCNKVLYEAKGRGRNNVIQG